MIILMLIEPVLTIILLWTDPYHGWFYGEQRSANAILLGGVWFWVNVVYSYLISLMAAVFLIIKLRSGTLFTRRQTATILSGISFPLVANMVSLSGLNPFPGLDLTPFFFTFSGLIIAVGLLQFRLFDLVPIAREKLIENMSDGLIVINQQGVIVDMNPAAQEFCSQIPASIGDPAEIAFARWPAILTDLQNLSESCLVMRFENADSKSYEATLTPIITRDGKNDGMAIHLHDITSHELTKETLATSENKLRSLFSAMTDVILILDGDGRYIEIASTNADLLYLPSQELIGKTLHEVLPSEFAYQYLKVIQETLKTGKISPIDYQLPIREKLIWFAGNVSRLSENRVLWVARDITERKVAEEELRKSEAKLRALFSAMMDVILVFDSDGRYLEIAPTSTTALFLTPAELLGKTITEILPADIAADTLQAIRQSIATKTLTHVDYSLPIANEQRWFSAAISPLTDDTVIFVAQDITDKRKSSQALKEQEIQYEGLVNSLGEGIAIVDLTETFVIANPKSHMIFGVPPNSLSGRNVQEFVDKNTFEFLKLQTDERIAGKSGQYDLKIFRPDGVQRLLQVSPRPQVDRNGSCVGTFVVFRDITEQKQAEEALLQSENKLRSLFTAMSDIIIIYDVNGRYVEIAPTNLSKLYRPPEELLNHTIAEIFEPDIAQLFMKTIEATLRTGEMTRVDYNMTIGNTNYWFSANVSPMSEDRVIWVARDITERKKVEETLQYHSNHDILTGLYNRQYYEAEIIRLQHGRQFPISIIMMDVDGLKWVNDNRGHTAGDELLQRVAGVLKSAFRPEDLVARVGGDEFVVILPGTTSAIAGQAIHRLNSVLTVHNSLFPSDEQLRLSIGKATGLEKSLLTEVFKEADQAMYLDKMEKKKGGL